MSVPSSCQSGTRPYIPVTDPRARAPEFAARLHQGRSPSRALAVKLDAEDCIMRWAEILYEEVYPGQRSQMSPEEFREDIKDMRTLTVNYMAYRVYCEFPNVPRLGRAGLLVPCPKLTWLFVFKDNSSHEVRHAPLDPVDVQGVKAFLGVKKQGAKWYDVTRRKNPTLPRASDA
ncbi:hypothetical protein C8T65DRAFT_830386 [Cerioporus squamosus]|nr:hypothetical protein C8T65DRAFT_830386 [Cerioporus squamosus]